MSSKITVKREELDNDGDILDIVDGKSLGSGDKIVHHMYMDDEISCSLKDIAGNTITYKFVEVSGEEMSNMHPSTVLQTADTGGQFLVISNPNEVFGTTATSPKVMIPKDSKVSIAKSLEKSTKPTLNTSGLRVQRDDKRRATHNEVERRRRDKINTWICKLGALVPYIDKSQSKGGILAHACDYIIHLSEEQERLQNCLAENEQLKSELARTRQELSSVLKENSQLRSKLGQDENCRQPDENS